ncbi:MAG TPA: hypothetical protein VGA67_01015 [Candidatus Dojkabacteria bacterium]|jgi:hypothetical protein
MINFFQKHFYRNMGIARFLGIYVLGDAIVIVPFLIIFLPLTFLFQGWYGVAIGWSLYMGVRHFIEIFYWLFQQFVPDGHRPGFPFKQFGNKDVFIIHQVLNTVYSVAYFTILIFLVMDRL